MTAPIFECEIKGYDLKTEISKINDSKFILKVMNIYNYDDIWTARNAYEKYFEETDDSDNKRIVMIGDSKCMVVTLIREYIFTSEQEAIQDEIEVKRNYILNIARNEYMRADVLRMIENYDDKARKECYLEKEINRVLDMKFEDVGMSHHSLYIFKRLCITCVREYLRYREQIDKMRREGGFLCSGKYLTKSSMEELRDILKKENMLWLVEKRESLIDDEDLPFK